jgi:signal transduction histidine kinase
MEAEVNLLLGLAEVFFSLIVLFYLGRFARSFPWLAVLGVFFLVRGMDRIYVGALGREPVIAPIVTDGLLIAVVVLLLLGTRRTLWALRQSLDDAEWRQREYERALRDYRALVRHRIANPLTVVLAGVDLLRRRPPDSPEIESKLLEEVHASARHLEHVSLDPWPVSEEERQLAAQPRLPVG